LESLGEERRRPPRLLVVELHHPGDERPGFLLLAGHRQPVLLEQGQELRAHLLRRAANCAVLQGDETGGGDEASGAGPLPGPVAAPAPSLQRRSHQDQEGKEEARKAGNRLKGLLLGGTDSGGRIAV